MKPLIRRLRRVTGFRNVVDAHVTDMREIYRDQRRVAKQRRYAALGDGLGDREDHSDHRLDDEYDENSPGTEPRTSGGEQFHVTGAHSAQEKERKEEGEADCPACRRPP